MSDDIGINRVCSGIGPGREGVIDPLFLARIQKPGWKAMERINSDTCLGALVDTVPSRVCKRCGQTWQPIDQPYATVCPACHALQKYASPDRYVDGRRERDRRRCVRRREERAQSEP